MRVDPISVAPRRTDRYFRSRLLALLQRLEGGEVHLYEGGSVTRVGQGGPLQTDMKVLDAQFYRDVALGGSVGAGESYMAGRWQCENLVNLMRLLVRNRGLLDRLERGWARPALLALRWLHRRNRNTQAGSRRNISAHYDLGNEFFELFLGKRMMYSSAWYHSADDTLDQAQERRLRAIAEQLELRPGQKILEIGTGWGGLALYLAQNHDVDVTTTTISDEQHAYAARLVQQAGLGDRVTLLKQDYRELSGQYDRLVSIEMIEAVGAEFLDTYLARCCSLLKADGRLLLQAIVIEDHRYRLALREVDFIKRYIFPGSFIPSVSAIMQSVADNTDLMLHALTDIGSSYALTLAEWRRRCQAQTEAIAKLGYDTAFQRMWEFYLAYCEAGFAERALGDVHMVFSRPLAERGLPRWD